PAHASAQLVKLAQSVAVGAIDEHGVCKRNINAVFDDRGGNEHVVLVMHEGENHAFKLGFAHLAMAHNHARRGHQFLNARRNLVDEHDAIVHEIDLPAALEFHFDGGADNLLVEFRHHG